MRIYTNIYRYFRNRKVVKQTLAAEEHLKDRVRMLPEHSGKKPKVPVRTP